MCFDGEPPECARQDIRTARKQHKCTECRCTIEPGERYEVISGKWDGEFLRYKTCRKCISLRACITRIELRHGCHDVEAVPPLGYLMEAAQEMDMYPTTA